MSAVEGTKPYYERVQQWSVPLHDGKCTARDVSDLLRVADREVRTALLAAGKDPKLADYDDAFYIETDGDRLFVEIRTVVAHEKMLEL